MGYTEATVSGEIGISASFMWPIIRTEKENHH